ncbi:MAG: hypothetical protein VB015_01980 [Erysipelotrichaceae bacterium]|nr:hypothetical protein [Erysipelotrichaceae bacterium]
MKLRLSLYRMTYTFIIAAIVAAALLFGSLFWLFLDPVLTGKAWTWQQWTVIAVFLASTVFFYVFTILQNYYILERKYILVHRFKKEMYYYFSEIVYIDEAYSKKHKMVLFVTNRGDVRYLTFDREGKVYDAMLERCQNLLDFDTLKARYPNIKL